MEDKMSKFATAQTQEERKPGKKKPENVEPKNPIESYSGDDEDATMSKHMHLLLKPQAYINLRKISIVTKTPVNQMLNGLIAQFLKESAAIVDEYDEKYAPILGQITEESIKKGK